MNNMGNDFNPQDNQNNQDDEQEFDTDFDAGVDADENEDPKKYIQQLTGKLSQTLRKYNSELPSPDADLNKYVVGMINKQAVKGLSEKDVSEIFKELKSDEEPNEEDSDNEDDENSNDMPNDMNLDNPNDNFQNESVDRQRINEIFQEIINGNQNDKATTKIENNGGYKKMPFTAPKFKK